MRLLAVRGNRLCSSPGQNTAVLATGGDTNTPFAWGSVPNSGGALDYGNAVTLEAWIKPTAGDLGSSRLTYIAGSTIGAAGFNFGIQDGTLFVDTKTTGGIYNYAQQTSVTLVADTWAHVAAVLSNDGATSTATVYVNGASVATSSWADTALGSASSILNIGANGTGAKYVMFRSQIDEVRLSNVAREFGTSPPVQSGDFNSDDIVDGDDFLIWQRGLGTTTGATLAQGDANGDEAVNDVDLSIWRSQFGMPAVPAVASVPEPASLMLVLAAIGGAACVARRRLAG